MGAVALALLLVLAQPVAEPTPLERCEAARRANLDHALTWEGRAHECRANHRAALDRLAVRTATPTPAVVEFRAVDSGASAGTLVLGGAAAFLLGVVAGLGIALAAK